MKRIILLPLTFFYISLTTAQVDVKKYSYDITVNDLNDRVEFKGFIDLALATETKEFTLNLEAVTPDGKGMKISSLELDGEDCAFDHEDRQVRFKTRKAFAQGNHQITFEYAGIPTDGLVIGQNKFGDRTFFGDNWPNRAQCWLLCNDHPSDKALIDFTITAPNKYTAVSNGALLKKEEVENSTKYYYSSSYELPTKVTVIGVAELISANLPGKDYHVVNYVYPQSGDAGLKDMECAENILTFYEKYIGAYPFEKLYNVQSTTRFGGMENAGCIFYDENAVTGKGTMENLVAHEIAHQWFGNCATEKDWQDLWLSEGFATYFTNLYIEQTYGQKAFHDQLKRDRKRVIQFSKKYDHPVIDKEYADLMDLLNPNSYQKGAWVLHMLRMTIGDEAFQRSIREYFNKYKYSNADSHDFLNILQEFGGMNLEPFFEQWLETGGHPIIQSKIKQDQGKNTLIIEQIQEHVFQFPLEIHVLYGDLSEMISIEIYDRKVEIPLKEFEGKIKYELDPQVKILMEATME